MKFRNLIAKLTGQETKLTSRETKYMLVNCLPSGIESKYPKIDIYPEEKARQLDEHIFSSLRRRHALIDQNLRTFDEAIAYRKEYIAKHPDFIEGYAYKTY
jgi:hypothetical protein